MTLIHSPIILLFTHGQSKEFMPVMKSEGVETSRNLEENEKAQRRRWMGQN